MPSKKNANDIKVGSGRAGQGSVTASSLVVNMGSGSGSGDIWASQVRTHTPPRLQGKDVQRNLDEFHSLAPAPPNTLDSLREDASNEKNPVTAVIMDAVIGRYTTASNVEAEAVLIRDAQTKALLFPVFPADQGILALKVGGIITQAVDLRAIFVEGSTLSVAAPARIVRQLNYTNTGHALDESNNFDASFQVGNHPQIPVTYRFPYQSSYAEEDFPSIPVASDLPLHYPDGYDGQFHSYQIATIELSVSVAAGTSEIVTVVHYRSITDYEKDQASEAYETFSEVSLSEIWHEDAASLPMFYDDLGNSSQIAFQKVSLLPTDSDPASSGSVHMMSGVAYYLPTDDFRLEVEATGFYNKSYKDEGLTITPYMGSIKIMDIHYPYTSYSPNGTLPAATSAIDVTDTLLGLVPANKIALVTHTEAVGTTPFDLITTEESSVQNVLVSAHEETPFATPSSVESKKEIFVSERPRYVVSTLPSESILPNGGGGLFPNEDPLGIGELQVGHPHVTNALNQEGGGLMYPYLDYSTGYWPATTDGTSNQPNYSAATGTRGWIRSFDAESSSLVGKFEIVINVENPFEAFQFQEGESYEGHAGGLSIWVAPAGILSQQWLDLGKPFEEGGALLSYEVNAETNSVIVSYKLDNHPQLDTGFYPIAMKIVMYAGSPAQTDGLVVHRVELIS